MQPQRGLVRPVPTTRQARQWTHETSPALSLLLPVHFRPPLSHASPVAAPVTPALTTEIAPTANAISPKPITTPSAVMPSSQTPSHSVDIPPSSPHVSGARSSRQQTTLPPRQSSPSSTHNKRRDASTSAIRTDFCGDFPSRRLQLRRLSRQMHQRCGLPASIAPRQRGRQRLPSRLLHP